MQQHLSEKMATRRVIVQNAEKWAKAVRWPGGGGCALVLYSTTGCACNVERHAMLLVVRES